MSLFGKSEKKAVQQLKQEIKAINGDFRMGPRSVGDLGDVLKRLAEKVKEAESLLNQGRISQEEFEDVRKEAQAIAFPRK
jgi:hypothetical protein